MTASGGRIRTGPAGTPLMIIERIQQQLIMRVRWGQAEGPGNAEAEESGHMIVDHGSAHCIDLSRRQHIQQGRAGDKPTMINRTVGQEPIKRLDTAIDDHRVARLAAVIG